MRLGSSHPFAYFRQQGTEGLTRARAHADHQRIQETADQRLGFQPIASGHRHPDANIVLVAITLQHGAESREQEHKTGCTMLLRTLLKHARHRSIEPMPDRCSGTTASTVMYAVDR